MFLLVLVLSTRVHANPRPMNHVERIQEHEIRRVQESKFLFPLFLQQLYKREYKRGAVTPFCNSPHVTCTCVTQGLIPLGKGLAWFGWVMPTTEQTNWLSLTYFYWQSRHITIILHKKEMMGFWINLSKSQRPKFYITT